MEVCSKEIEAIFFLFNCISRFKKLGLFDLALAFYNKKNG
jgi:hypothetical protein